MRTIYVVKQGITEAPVRRHVTPAQFVEGDDGLDHTSVITAFDDNISNFEDLEYISVTELHRQTTEAAARRLQRAIEKLRAEHVTAKAITDEDRERAVLPAWYFESGGPIAERRAVLLYHLEQLYLAALDHPGQTLMIE